ncbi:hypothetical protein BPP43_06560 [Brachyspira pilosicoli P43/6/78]|uniref:Uncharacterized protein n=1 Tax=Brachyspira pilosicoli P43/6/78 TaxID=1042417 RepID=A0A3B6VL63_BRAPL|nr:hypothetical protein BPP43_06560 [Brachyspira pilosicoli P43/6/78]
MFYMYIIGFFYIVFMQIYKNNNFLYLKTEFFSKFFVKELIIFLCFHIVYVINFIFL